MDFAGHGDDTTIGADLCAWGVWIQERSHVQGDAIGLEWLDGFGVND